jgi:hypothetical protein
MNAAIPERRPATEEISGVIERVTFHNADSGFCVLRVKARGQREETTVVGSLPSVTAGEWLSARVGRFVLEDVGSPAREFASADRLPIRSRVFNPPRVYFEAQATGVCLPRTFLVKSEEALVFN